MDNENNQAQEQEEVTGIKISEFPASTALSESDTVTGLQAGGNVRFTMSSILSWIALKLSNAFVSASRTINGKSLSSDVTLTASDVGARPSTWTPSAADVGAVPATEKGAPLGVAELDSNGQVPSSQLDLSGKQDEITASGILKGDGAGGVSAATPGTDYQAPLTIDATPTANSTKPVQSGGVYTDVRTRVPNYGKGQNLLRNWYFLNPVNQRGQSSYTGAVRGIDGWVCRMTTGSVSVTTNGVTLSKGSGNAIDFYQPQEEAFNKQLAEKIVTVSVLLYPNRLEIGTGKWKVSASGALITASDFSVSLGQTQTAWSNFYIRATSDITIQAIKLELGSESTLCHNEGTEANPVWVLNEIADFEEELIKCQTNTSVSGDYYANKSLAIRQDLTSIQATGTTNTTGAAIPTGTYFYLNGILCRAKEQIGTNASFTVNTNYEQVTVGAKLTAIDSKMYQVVYEGNATYTYTMPAGRWFLIYANRANNSGTGLYAAHITGNNGFLTTIFETSGFSNLIALTLSGRTLSVQVKSNYATLNILNFGGV